MLKDVRTNASRTSNGNYTRNFKILYPRIMPLIFKRTIYKTVIRAVVLYELECSATKGSDEGKLHVAEMRVLRWICSDANG